MKPPLKDGGVMGGNPNLAFTYRASDIYFKNNLWILM
jgi:hypothetical protein